MDPDRPKPSPHREDTDASLKKERDKSDEEVHRGNGRTARVADDLITQERGDADEVLRAARSADAPVPGGQQARDAEDAAISLQRAQADSRLQEERRERTRSLAALFAFERQLTDQHLLVERNRADQALTSRDDFLGMVAHDLRGFMGEIVFRATLLHRAPGEGAVAENSRRSAEAILRSAAGMRRLVSDLLDVAALEAGRLRVEAVRSDLANVLRDAAEPFRAAAAEKNLVLELEETPSSAIALFDHDRVVQVLGNLVANAIKFTPAGGRIALRLAVSGGEARLAVADTGVGIPAAKLGEIFERYTQLAKTDRRGLGLGLYIAKCLVEAQQGRIWAESAPGAGSTFFFTLPLAP